MASQIIALLSVAHSKSLEDLLAQQKEHGIIKDRPSSSQFFKDLADNSGAVLAQFYSMAKSTCWVRPMILVNGVWTPIQGNDFWRSSCRLSLFVNRRQVPESVVDTDFVPHGLFIEPVQYWGAAPSLIKTWGWARVCTEIVRYSMFGCLRLVEPFEEAESVEPIAHLALGPVISGVAQEEQSYFFESPESPPPTFQRQDTSTSCSDSPMHFNSDDIPLDDTADVQPTLPAITVDLSPLLDDLKISLLKRMDNALSDILSRLHTVERSLRDTLGQQNEYFRNLIQSVRQDGKNQDDIQTLCFNAFQKVVLAQGVTAGADSVEVKKEIKALDAKINSLDGQLGDLIDYIHGGDAKKGEGSSSRRPLPPPVNQGEGSGGDTVRTTEIAQRDILERLMAADRQRERERDMVTMKFNRNNTIRSTAKVAVNIDVHIRVTRDRDVIFRYRYNYCSSDHRDITDGNRFHGTRDNDLPKRFLKEPLRSGEDDDMSGSKQPSKIIDPAAAEKDKEIDPVATEDLSLAKSVATMTDSEDTEPLSKGIMLPSVTAANITRIIFGLGIEIPEVNEGDWYKASLPRIATSDKGKAILVAKDEIKGHPAREMFSLICTDIDFLVQLREKVIADVVSFFHSFSLSRLAIFGSVKDNVAKEEQMLAWAETYYLETAAQRRMNIIAKYREMLLRKFLEAHRENF
ncbi:DEAD-box ATP-dependent RNA helicase 7 [Dorcoceras hygrometricum]|uniref:DEAD-box ATP-dependent RNA helicase 7 n=1 Tax=Dorcoceras hygrometricum TaxID=472368 RepID=A0A2Z7D4C6_9LAMI|nr:DEAD-box ATP-dependent RNA helicase 7 [Dorcoceras hygrometricum]